MLRPMPQIGINYIPYWEYCSKEQLRIPRCRCCGRYIWPALPYCPDDLSDDIEWAPVSKVGIISSWVVYNRLYHREFKDMIPYVCAAIDLPEGVRIIGNVFSDNADDMRADFLKENFPTNLLNDREVELFFEDVTEDLKVPQWRLLREI